MKNKIRKVLNIIAQPRVKISTYTKNILMDKGGYSNEEIHEMSFQFYFNFFLILV